MLQKFQAYESSIKPLGCEDGSVSLDGCFVSGSVRVSLLNI